MALPVEINPLHLQTSGGYSINKSLRFRSSASANLNRTPASGGSTTSWTISAWVKMGLPSQSSFFAAGSGQGNGTATERLSFNDTMYWQRAVIQTANVYDYSPTQKFRDYSAWQHIMYVWDSNNATSTQRQRYFINGVQVTSLSGTQCGSGQASIVNSAINHRIGVNYDSTTSYGDFYLAEFYFIDGQSLSASSFGAYDSNGVWQPIKYTGTYGTNGCYLKFNDTSSVANLGLDSSGNGNTWTVNNVSLTAGTTYDSMTDSPTVTSASVANYAVLNALNNFSVGLTNANLDVSTTSGYAYATATFSFPSSGKWYWEYTNTSAATLANQRGAVGFALQGYRGSTTYFGQLSTDWAYIGFSGNIINNTVGTAYGNTWTQNDVVGIALDCATGKFWFSKNGTFQASGDPVAGTNQAGTLVGSVNTYAPIIGNVANTSGLSCVGSANFGQRAFTYTPPTGFNALNTYNLPTPAIANGAKYMAATTYTGTGATQSITNGGNNTIGTTFRPDLLWIKRRDSTGNNSLQDVLRGSTVQLSSNLTSAEVTDATQVTSFNSNGFTMGASGGAGYNVNASTATYVGWQWNANGSGVSNTNGSITSTVSANTTAGFSVVTYTGNATAGATVGHGLGVAPSMVIARYRAGVGSWAVYHSALGATNWLTLNGTGATTVSAQEWNNTNPTSSVFTVGNASSNSNQSGNNVAYCWAAVAGYSAFGSYTGNASTNGPFVYCGFRPRFVLLKNTAQSADWFIVDTSRNTSNAATNYLEPDNTDAEASGVGDNLDFLSNGFKIKTTNLTTNGSGNTIIYAAFAENPFNSSRAR